MALCRQQPIVSQHWIERDPSAAIPEPGPGGIPAGFNTEACSLEGPGVNGEWKHFDSLHSRGGDVEGNVGIRLPQYPSGPQLPLGSFKLAMVVCFGKPSQPSQVRACPFERPTNPHHAFRFDFSVGAEVTDALGNVRQYSHDPEMDIGL